MKRPLLTDDWEYMAVELWAKEGLSLRKIAQRVGVSHERVRTLIKNNKIKRKPGTGPERKRYYCPSCGQEKSETSKLCESCFHASLRTNHDKILYLWRIGSTSVEIAAAVGCTDASVRRIITKMRREGIEIPYRNKENNQTARGNDE